MISIAAVIPGSETPVGVGTTGAMRCSLVLPDGARRAAILKRGPLAHVAAEAFSAILLRRWGLPVPDPFLIPESDGVAFASADAGYPNLKQRLWVSALMEGAQRATAELAIFHIATTLQSAPLAAVVDQAIDNRDRNLENILWDGAREAWIDHAYAMGNGRQMRDVNKLCDMSTQAGTHVEMCKSAVAKALALDAQAIHHAAPQIPGVLGPERMATFVAARMTSLASAVLDRFPQPDDLLSAAR
ncbi:predicted protein [Burkholderiales bacterium GJ-E10]|nr:predicted protein [Burkholderiales bacterium GJ-E10]